MDMLASNAHLITMQEARSIRARITEEYGPEAVDRRIPEDFPGKGHYSRDPEPGPSLEVIL